MLTRRSLVPPQCYYTHIYRTEALHNASSQTPTRSSHRQGDNQTHNDARTSDDDCSEPRTYDNDGASTYDDGRSGAYDDGCSGT